MWPVFGFFVCCGVSMFVGLVSFNKLRGLSRRFVEEVSRPGKAQDVSGIDVLECGEPGDCVVFFEAVEDEDEEVCVFVAG